MSRALPGALAAVAAALLSLSRPVAPAAATELPLATGAAAVGRIEHQVTRYEDTLPDIARDHDLGYTQLVAANRGIDPWLPGAGHRLVLPTRYLLPDVPHRGIVVNLVQQRLFYFPKGGGRVQTFPLGVGAEGKSTPTGATRVVRKEDGPTWYPPASIRAEKPELPSAIPPGPDNPLGAYALYLGWPSYLIHGTNKPYGVGRTVSHGCLRMYPKDVERLFHEVPVGTPVRVISEEVVAAWLNDGLYVQVFPSKDQAVEIAYTNKFTPAMPPSLVEKIGEAAGKRTVQLDWDAIRRAGIERTGVPVRVSLPVGTPVAANRTAPDQTAQDKTAQDETAQDRPRDGAGRSAD